MSEEDTKNTNEETATEMEREEKSRGKERLNPEAKS